MALLYERSALWRAIVSATRDPRILVLFTVTTAAGGYALGKGSEMATAGASEKVKDDMEKKLRKDVEAARYANHSKNALAVMFDSLKPAETDTANDPNAKYKKHPIKLPGVMWHPKVAQKDKENAAKKREAEAKQTNTNAAHKNLREAQSSETSREGS